MAYDPLTRLEDVKVWLGIAQSQTADDAQLSQLIVALSRLVGRYCGRDNLGNTLSYVERRASPGPSAQPYTKPFRFVLKHYPIVTLSSITLGTNPGATVIPVATDPATQSGALVLEDNRTIELVGYAWFPAANPIIISYTAGYVPFDTPGVPSTIPEDLQLVVQQWIGEIRKSKTQVGFKSQALAGQVTTFEDGKDLGMSPRTRAMLQPFKDRVPNFL